MVGEVPLGQQEQAGPAAVDLAADLDLASGAAFDAEHGAVGQRPHEVADTCPVLVGELELWVLHASCTDERVLDASCKVGGFGVGAGQQDGIFPVEEVGQKSHGGFVVHGLAVSGTDPAVRVVGGQGARVAAAELE